MASSNNSDNGQQNNDIDARINEIRQDKSLPTTVRFMRIGAIRRQS